MPPPVSYADNYDATSNGKELRNLQVRSVFRIYERKFSGKIAFKLKSLMANFFQVTSAKLSFVLKSLRIRNTCDNDSQI